VAKTKKQHTPDAEFITKALLTLNAQQAEPVARYDEVTAG
jgi:hypothetical protein